MFKNKKFIITSVTLGTILFTSTIGQGASMNYSPNNTNYNSRGYSINQSFYDKYTQQNYNYNWQVITIPNRKPIINDSNKPVQPNVPVEPNNPTTPERPVRPTEPSVPSKPVEPDTPVENEKPTVPNTPNTPGLSQMEMEVVRLVNIERQNAGLTPFTASTELSRVARLKSEDMGKNNYFSHTSPTYGSPFDMMKSQGIKYNTAGENIAKGYQTAQSVVKGWMNSSGHRANILNPSFKTLGVGTYTTGNGTIYWTQMFTN